MTDRGNPVGELVPVQRDRRSTLEQKIARGEVVPPERPNAAVWETPPLPAAPGQALPSEVLQRMRDEERF